MYYKIIDKTSKQYKKLHKLRTKELKMEKDNLKALNERLGFEWDKFIGYPGQQNFNRVPIYMGFKPKSMEEIDFTIWRKDKEHPDFIVPNRKTKAGRDMAEFLSNGLQGSRYSNVFDILGLEHGRKFTLPYVEICVDGIVLYLDENTEPDEKFAIEITKKEFDQLLKDEREKL